MESPGDKFVPLATMILTLCFMAQLLYICYNSMIRSIRPPEDEYNGDQFGWVSSSYQHTEELNYNPHAINGFHPGKYHPIDEHQNKRPKIYGPENIYDTLQQSSERKEETDEKNRNKRKLTFQG